MINGQYDIVSSQRCFLKLGSDILPSSKTAYMGSFSPYSINEADPPQWRPGEDIAAAAFVGITLYLFVEVNVVIFRAFKKRQGLYFWSMQIGSLGILMESVGIILKYFASPSTNAIWPLYTLLLAIGWGIYTTAQSLVLYSRLHLVMRNRRIQRYVLYMIVSTVFIFVVPHLILMWPAYNTSNHDMSSLWSPREAIVQRYTQLGYTITESIVSGLYIWSLVGLLRLKSNVRQRRVMTDLIYVNVVVIAFDILQVGFVYTNQLGISQPVQSFNYILKLRLEFVVLNQLMDIASRGTRRKTFEKNRYYQVANRRDMPSHDNAPPQDAINSGLINRKDSSKDPAQTTLPSSISSPKSTYQVRPANRSASYVQISGPEYESELNSLDHTGTADQKGLNGDSHPLTEPAKLGAGFFSKMPQGSKDSNNQSSGRSKGSKLLAFRRRDRSHPGNSGENEDDEEEIELQMWERGGIAVMDVPWFRSKVEA